MGVVGKWVGVALHTLWLWKAEKKLLQWTWSYECPQVTHLAWMIKKRAKHQYRKNFSSSTGFIALSTAAATALGCKSIIFNGTNWPPFNINLTWGLDSKCQSTISDLTLYPQSVLSLACESYCTISNDTLTNYVENSQAVWINTASNFRLIPAQNGFIRPKTQNYL